MEGTAAFHAGSCLRSRIPMMRVLGRGGRVAAATAPHLNHVIRPPLEVEAQQL